MRRTLIAVTSVAALAVGYGFADAHDRVPGVLTIDEAVAEQEGQHVVAVDPLLRRRVDLDPVVEVEERQRARALPHERVEGAQQGPGGDPARLQHQDLLARQPRRIKQGQRHLGGLAGAGGRLQHGLVALGQGGAQGGQYVVDGQAVHGLSETAGDYRRCSNPVEPQRRPGIQLQ